MVIYYYDIIMYEIKDKLGHFRKRLNDMRGEREPFENQWYFNQLQVEAQSYEDGDKFYPNTKLEQAIIEMRLWGRTSDITIDVEPDQYEPNLDEAIIAKHVLYKFMHEEEWHKQLRYWRHDKAVTGTGVFFCGISHDITCEIKRDEVKLDVQVGNGYFNNKGKKKVYNEKWYFMPQNVPLASFYVDDNAMQQPDFARAVDCIMCEFGDKEDLIAKYKNVPWVDKDALESLMPTATGETEYGQDVKHGQIVLYHYFNRITKDWYIVGNEKAVIYETMYEFDCEWLPFVLCQHHPRNNKLYGMGDPEVIAALKATKNATWQAIVGWTLLSSGKLLLSGNSGEFTDSMDNAARVYSWEITIKEVTNSVENYKQIDTNINMSNNLNLLQLIDDEVRAATGIDVRAAFEAPEQNLGQTEIKEENKAIRLKAIDELEDLAIGAALTIALANIVKFAPVLKRSTKEISFNGNIKEFESEYTITIPDVTIKKKGKNTMVEEDMWSYGELEFTKDLIKGNNKVRVTTASTNNSKLNVIEKNKAKEMVNIIKVLSEVYGLENIIRDIPLEQSWSIVAHAYWLGDKDTVVKSKKKKIKDKNAAMLKAFWDFISTMWDGSNQQGVQWPIEGAWEITWGQAMPTGWGKISDLPDGEATTILW